MAQLYYRYGTVGSAKTLNLLAVAHNYETKKSKYLLIKPQIDVRFGSDIVRTRAGLEKKADLVLAHDAVISVDKLNQVEAIIVDEAQFLSPVTIDNLYEISEEHNIPVMCYGLRTDFKGHLFPGSQRLMELADKIEEIKNVCVYCNKKSSFNLKLVDGKPTFSGQVIDLGCEEKYLGVCKGCFLKAKKDALASV